MTHQIHYDHDLQKNNIAVASHITLEYTVGRSDNLNIAAQTQQLFRPPTIKQQELLKFCKIIKLR